MHETAGVCNDDRGTNRGCGLYGGQETGLVGCFLHDFRFFGIDVEGAMDDCNPGRPRMSQESGIKEVERIMAN